MTALAIGSPSRRLAAVLALPAGAPRGGVVVCHPHPQYGGDMENPVVTAAARAAVAGGFAALRFDFGDWSGGTEEIGDVETARGALAERLPAGTPLALVGYSFGAWAALRAVACGSLVRRVVAIGPPLAFFDWDFLGALAVPVDVVVGDRDQYCDRARVARLPDRIAVHTVPGADHFFAGREAEIAALVVERLA